MPLVQQLPLKSSEAVNLSASGRTWPNRRGHLRTKMKDTPLNILGVKQKLGALAREAIVHARSVVQGTARPAVLFFPSQGLDDGAARLRAYNIAERLRGYGWRSLTCPKHLNLAARQRVIARFRPNIIVMQTARHPLNRPDLYPNVPCVMDLDDADYIDPVSAAPLADALERSAGVIAGSRAVAEYCRTKNSRVRVVWTGTPPSNPGPPPQTGRQRLITWAASSPVGSAGETAFVRSVLEHLVSKNCQFKFRMYCDDGTPEFQDYIAKLVPPGIVTESLPYLYYPKFLQSLDTVAVGLAPLVNTSGFSGGKSFGKVLAYVDRGIPVVTHPVVDHPLFFRNGVNGFMLETAAEWADAIVQLLDDAELRERLSEAARNDFLRRLTAEASTSLVNEFLKDVLHPEAG